MRIGEDGGCAGTAGYDEARRRAQQAAQAAKTPPPKVVEAAPGPHAIDTVEDGSARSGTDQYRDMFREMDRGAPNGRGRGASDVEPGPERGALSTEPGHDVPNADADTKPADGKRNVPDETAPKKNELKNVEANDAHATKPEPKEVGPQKLEGKAPDAKKPPKRVGPKKPDAKRPAGTKPAADRSSPKPRADVHEAPTELDLHAAKTKPDLTAAAKTQRMRPPPRNATKTEVDLEATRELPRATESGAPTKATAKGAVEADLHGAKPAATKSAPTEAHGAPKSGAKGLLKGMEKAGGVVAIVQGAHLVAKGVERAQHGEKVDGALDVAEGGALVVAGAGSVAGKAAVAPIYAAVQAVDGMRDLGEGFATGDTEKAGLGGMKIASGVLMLDPLTMPLGMALGLGVAAYEHREELGELGNKLVNGVKEAAHAVEQATTVPGAAH